jgi:hypothetical protein
MIRVHVEEDFGMVVLGLCEQEYLQTNLLDLLLQQVKQATLQVIDIGYLQIKIVIY